MIVSTTKLSSVLSTNTYYNFISQDISKNKSDVPILKKTDGSVYKLPVKTEIRVEFDREGKASTEANKLVITKMLENAEDGTIMCFISLIGESLLELIKTNNDWVGHENQLSRSYGF